MIYTCFDKRSGRMIQSYEGINTASMSELFDLAEGIEPDSRYLSAGKVIDRPSYISLVSKSQIIANGIDVATISGLPNPSTCHIRGPIVGEVIVTDGSLDFSAALPGSYVISISSFPYLDQEIAINAI